MLETWPDGSEGLNREVFKAGEVYNRSEFVTWNGSLWLALTETRSKPGTDDNWKLIVRAGRDGARK